MQTAYLTGGEQHVYANAIHVFANAIQPAQTLPHGGLPSRGREQSLLHGADRRLTPVGARPLGGPPVQTASLTGGEQLVRISAVAHRQTAQLRVRERLVRYVQTALAASARPWQQLPMDSGVWITLLQGAAAPGAQTTADSRGFCA